MNADAQGLALTSGALPERPTLRGVMHLVVAFGAAAGLAWLLLAADSASGYVGGAVFGASLVLLYGTSATYHRINWRPAGRRLLKRLDHSMIWVLIGGTYTPFCLKIDAAWGISILSVVWAIAGAGVLMKLIWPDLPRWISVTLYLALGWLGVLAVSEVLDRFAGVPIAMLVAGGVLYTLGGVVYALRRPDPWPRLFGYHEVFHTFVVAGSAVHFVLVARFVLPA